MSQQTVCISVEEYNNLINTLERSHNMIYNKGSQTVTISIEEYQGLIRSRDRLCALESAGVDNWSGYPYAMELLEEEKENE